MKDYSASATDPRDLGIQIADVQDHLQIADVRDLLVLTDSRLHGRAALALPFHTASVLELGTDDRVDEIDGQYDAIIIDRDSFDLRWLHAAGQRAIPALRPGGRLIILFYPGDDVAVPGDTTDAAFAGLEWHGLQMLDGRLCAVMTVADRPDADSSPVTAMLTTAHTAFRLATEQSAGQDAQLRLQHATKTLSQQLEARRRSEHALLWHLEALATELDEERRQHRGLRLVRAVLRRSSSGRALLRVLRPLRPLADRLRDGLRPTGSAAHD